MVSKQKKQVFSFLLVFLSILLISTISAYSPVTDDTWTTTNEVDTQSSARGIKFSTNYALTLNSADVLDGVTHTIMDLEDSSNNLLMQTSIVGGVATFDYSLDASTTYYLVVHSNGSSGGFRGCAGSTPISLTGINLEDGYYRSVGIHTDDWYNVANVTTTQRDTTAPTGSIVSPTNATFSNTPNVNFIIDTTDETNLSNATLSIYNSSDDLYNGTIIDLTGTTNTTSIFVQLIDGVYHWFWTIYDLAGNLFSTQDDVGNYTLTQDLTFPQITIDYPANTTYNTTITEINFTLTDINPLGCWFSKNNGVTNTSISCAGNYATNSSSGTNTWIVTAEDEAGNINFTSITFQYTPIIPSTPSTPSVTGSSIYQTMDSSGAGLGKLIIYIAQSLPLLLIGLLIAVIIGVIGFGIAGLVRRFQN